MPRAGRRTELPPPCTCAKHEASAPRSVGEHKYRLQIDFDAPLGGERYRATCSCDYRSRWQHQSDSVAYHAWERHVTGRGDR